ncbi:MAG: HEAT repeat domain-containing protein [Candidatus Kariarchaeaceae archaeon]|jgi:HEAT repeat protein
MVDRKADLPFNSSELLEMLKSNDLDKQTVAARRIWTDWHHLKKRDVLLDGAPILLQLLKNEEESRHTWHFMMALGALKYKDALSYIVDKLIESKSENIKGFAADALSRYEYASFDQNTIDLLWELASSSDSLVVRVNSIRALGNSFIGTKNEDVSKRLMTLIDMKLNPAITATIIGLVGEIGSLAVVPDLAHIMITRRTEVDKKIAASALDQIASLQGFTNRADLLKRIDGVDRVKL